ncbi:MAG: glycosyltransferase family 4 protein [Ignavibacteriae bacterium]|nr:glycosyltransferase family 4 protein [Ignavibacteriota bacterium]
MTKPTTLHFCTSQSWGGLEIYACSMMVEIQKRGWKVWAVCYPDSKVEEFLKANNILTIDVPSYFKLSLRSIFSIRSLIKHEEISVVHVHFHRDIWQASLALLGNSKRKLLMSIYMGVNKKRDIFHRFIYSRVNAFFSSSKELNRVLPERYPVPTEKFHYLPYGRNVEHYKRDENRRAKIRSHYGIEPDDVVIGAMMRIDPGKSVMDFVESFLHLPFEFRERVKFLVVGEPTRKRHSTLSESPFETHCEEYYFQIKEFIRKNQLEKSIFLCGFQSDVIGYLSAMDVFVFPSRDELFSLVVLDAMAMKLPVIAANAGGNVYQVSDGVSGFLFQVGNSHDLALKIQEYLDHSELILRHGNSGREFVVAHHDMKSAVEKLLQFYL